MIVKSIIQKHNDKLSKGNRWKSPRNTLYLWWIVNQGHLVSHSFIIYIKFHQVCKEICLFLNSVLRSKTFARYFDFYAFTFTLGAIHKLLWQVFGFFWPSTMRTTNPPSLKVSTLLTFLDYLPTSSCKGSLWTTPLVS